MTSRFPLFRGVAALACAVTILQAAAPSNPSVPYTWRNVAIGGGGFVTGIVPHPKVKGLLYARTDVGGAYRWDATARRWIAITDWISEADWNLTGIESLAVDPNDPQRVYLAAGTYDRLPAAMLRSNDQGRTFQRTDVPIAMGGNESGRFAGERLAVDPTDGAVLFFGSRRDGLWRSGDAGATWTRVAGFPAPDHPEPQTGPGGWPVQPVGIVAVVFDPTAAAPGRPTPTLYAAVSTTGTNLFRSTDGGVTWTAVEHQPVGVRPNHLVMSPEHVLYLSYGEGPGPGQMTDGAVWKFDLNQNVWTDITPLKVKGADQPFGYGCVAFDPQHPATLFATTWSHWRPHDQIFCSHDRGATWTALWDDDSARWNYLSAPYTATRTPHWMGTIVVNPFDSDQVLFTTGYGIWASRDISQADSGRAVHWDFLDDGLEETVPLALLSSPVGAHLISGVGDIDGFRHEDIEVSPASGSFVGPRFSSTRDITYSTEHPLQMVRIGNAGRNVTVHAAMSEDGGRLWFPLHNDPPGGDNGMGRIALSANGKVLVWALSHPSAFVTDDRGKTWTKAEGISSEVSLAADPVDSARFYAFDPRTGLLAISTDGGRHFNASRSTFAALEERARGDVMALMPGRSGDVWVGSHTAGLYHSTDGGRTFERITPVDAADALGFGKAAPGQVSPAVYLRGTLAGRPGFYRSDDAGATWVRINDDAHQFGAANRPMIIGDPRVYGRVYLTTGGRGIIVGDPQ